MFVDKLRKDIKKVIEIEILEISKFLQYVSDNIKNDKLSQDDIRNLSLAYHRLWWFRKNLLKKHSNYKNAPKLPAVPEKKYLKAAKLDVEILLSRDPKLADLMSMPKFFEKDMDNAAVLISRKLDVANADGAKPNMRLESNGNLYYGESNCYEMDKNGRRYKLLKYLAENKGAHSTKFLTGKFGYTTVKAAGNDISKLNGIIEGKLSLKKVIDNVKPDGYCINKDYNIAVMRK